eukprot:2100107-Pyramimonas_sp.AAC.1
MAALAPLKVTRFNDHHSRKDSGDTRPTQQINLISSSRGKEPLLPQRWKTRLLHASGAHASDQQLHGGAARGPRDKGAPETTQIQSEIAQQRTRALLRFIDLAHERHSLVGTVQDRATSITWTSMS